VLARSVAAGDRLVVPFAQQGRTRMIEQRPVDVPVAKTGFVPDRCLRAPNSMLDRAFGIHVCNQREPRCRFHGPVFIQDQVGRQYECRAREGG
jgi:hypothetical protein